MSQTAACMETAGVEQGKGGDAEGQAEEQKRWEGKLREERLQGPMVGCKGGGGGGQQLQLWLDPG